MRSEHEKEAARDEHEYLKGKKAQIRVNVHPMLLPKRIATAEERKGRVTSAFALKVQKSESADIIKVKDDNDEAENACVSAL